MRPKPRPDWEKLLRAAAAVQGFVPGAVLVGGTAAALYAAHRFSFDADHVLGDLRDRFDELLEVLEQRPDWTTNRVAPPKLILGEFQGVETGLRQLIRARPLEVQTIETSVGSITVPTPEELLRIKGWLALTRNAVRDYVDLVALARWLGDERTSVAFDEFDECYRDVYREDMERDVSPALQLARQLTDPRPADLDRIELSNYKGIVPPWDDWDRVRDACSELATLIVDRLVGRAD